MKPLESRLADSQDTPTLVAAARRGDREALERLLARFRPGVYALCLDRTGDFDRAEDLTQEALIAAYSHLDALREGAAFGGWLRRIALNRCLAWQRRPVLATMGPSEEMQARVHQDVFRAAARREAAREVRAALADLPENNRLALIMFHLRGSSYREIAEFLGVPHTTVVGRLHRARAQLRSLLEARLQQDLQAVGESPSKGNDHHGDDRPTR